MPQVHNFAFAVEISPINYLFSKVYSSTQRPYTRPSTPAVPREAALADPAPRDAYLAPRTIHDSTRQASRPLRVLLKPSPTGHRDALNRDVKRLVEHRLHLVVGVLEL